MRNAIGIAALLVSAACSLELEGQGVELPRSEPHTVDIAMNGIDACAVTATGELFCWRLVGEARGRPRRIAIDVAVVDVEIGDGHACVRTEDGRVACWGGNMFGEVDASRERTEPAPTGVAYCLQGEPEDADPGNFRSEPVFLDGIDSAVSIAVGGRHSCALERDGALTCWGQSQSGSLGTRTDAESFQRVTTQRSAARGVTLSWATSCTIDGRGVLDCFGEPLRPTPPETALREVVLGHGRSCGITPQGELVCWGAADDCGLDEETQGVWRVAHARVQSVAIGHGNCIDCFVQDDGDAFCSPGIEGGSGDETDEAPWVDLDRVPLDDVAQIVIAGNDACARTQDGAVHCWQTSANDPGEQGRLRRIEL